MNKQIVTCLAGSAALCCLLAACGGETLSSSSVPAPVSSSQSQPQPTAQAAEPAALTAEKPVQGSLQPVKSDIFAGYDHFGAFTNGWAFVLKGEQAGYLSETGEYKPLYTVPEQALAEMNIDDIPQELGQKRAEIYYLTKNLACSENGIVPYYQNGLWGYSDLDGNIIVEPVYDRVEPLGDVALAHRQSESYRVLDMLNILGEVTYTGECWADDELGYYSVQTESGLATLYNTDGTVVLENLPYGYGNRPAAPADVYPGGVVLQDGKGSVTVFDRAGNKIAENIDGEVQYIFENGSIYYTSENGSGILDKDGNLIVEDNLSSVSDADESGTCYIRSRLSGKARRYDAQFNEIDSEPALYAVRGDSVQDEETLETVSTVYVVDQDGNNVMELQSRYRGEVYGMYYPTTPLVEGDWMYWCPDESTIEVYQIQKAQ